MEVRAANMCALLGNTAFDLAIDRTVDDLTYFYHIGEHQDITLGSRS
jgi:hypothetical protein